MTRRTTVAYLAVLAGCFLVGMTAGLTPFAQRIDRYAYDVMLAFQPADNWKPQSAVVAIDEATLSARGGCGTSGRSFRKRSIS